MANLSLRGTLLIPSGPEHDPERMHLHVICTEPDDDGLQLLVPISSMPAGPFDRTCTLARHEHRFLRKPSYANYRDVETVTRDALVVGIADKTFVPRPDVNPQTFLKIVRGIVASKRTPYLYKAFYLDRFVGTKVAA